MTKDMENNSILTGRQNFLGVIIPVYNGSKYLEQAVRSVLLQPCKDLHVVIVNDGSTDDSLRIATKLAEEDDRVTVLDQQNQGVSAARNNGIEHCLQLGFAYIGFLDSDDVWMRDFFTEALRNEMYAEGHDAYHFTWYKANESLTRGKAFPAEHNTVVPAQTARFGSHFCSYLYRAELFAMYSIRFPEGIRAQEDETFRYIYLTLADKIKSMDIPIFAYRSNSLSVCHASFDVTHRYFEDIIPAWEWAEKELRRLASKTNMVKRTDLEGCATMRKTFLSEYIEQACLHRVPWNVIKSQIQEVNTLIYTVKNLLYG